MNNAFKIKLRPYSEFVDIVRIPRESGQSSDTLQVSYRDSELAKEIMYILTGELYRSNEALNTLWNLARKGRFIDNFHGGINDLNRLFDN